MTYVSLSDVAMSAFSESPHVGPSSHRTYQRRFGGIRLFSHWIRCSSCRVSSNGRTRSDDSGVTSQFRRPLYVHFVRFVTYVADSTIYRIGMYLTTSFFYTIRHCRMTFWTTCFVILIQPSKPTSRTFSTSRHLVRSLSLALFRSFPSFTV